MLRTLAGYAIHPLAARTLMLEHGCEKTHNDAFRAQLTEEQIARLGWASIQLDGGIERVARKAKEWFCSNPFPKASREPAPISALRVGFISADGPLPDFMQLCARSLSRAGALVVLPEQSLDAPTIDYGEPAPSPGLHSMRAPTDHFVEILSGVGATGVEIIIAWTPNGPVPGHPFAPLFQVGPGGSDLVLSPTDPQAEARRVLDLIVRAASGSVIPKLAAHQHVDFQITRGLEGVSL